MYAEISFEDIAADQTSTMGIQTSDKIVIARFGMNYDFAFFILFLILYVVKVFCKGSM
jgi:hypothetical protein